MKESGSLYNMALNGWGSLNERDIFRGSVVPSLSNIIQYCIFQFWIIEVYLQQIQNRFTHISEINGLTAGFTMFGS